MQAKELAETLGMEIGDVEPTRDVGGRQPRRARNWILVFRVAVIAVIAANRYVCALFYLRYNLELRRVDCCDSCQ